jgi:hypothetical protein
MLLVLAVLAGAIHGALSVRPEDHVGRRRLASGKLARFTLKVQYLLALKRHTLTDPWEWQFVGITVPTLEDLTLVKIVKFSTAWKPSYR